MKTILLAMVMVAVMATVAIGFDREEPCIPQCDGQLISVKVVGEQREYFCNAEWAYSPQGAINKLRVKYFDGREDRVRDFPEQMSILDFPKGYLPYTKKR